MKTTFGIFLAFLIIGVVAALVSYVAVAVITWEPQIALWDQQARAFMTFIFWAQVAGFTIWRLRP